MLHRVAHVRSDVSEEPSASPDDAGARFLRNVGSYRTPRRNIPEDTILHSHRRENLKSYIILALTQLRHALS
jgi:hypothetical protein